MFLMKRRSYNNNLNLNALIYLDAEPIIKIVFFFCTIDPILPGEKMIPACLDVSLDENYLCEWFLVLDLSFYILLSGTTGVDSNELNL